MYSYYPCMKIGERGQVTIPQKFRRRFGLKQQTEVEFVEERGRLILQKAQSEAHPVDVVAGSCKGALGNSGLRAWTPTSKPPADDDYRPEYQRAPGFVFG